jgi:hypothetical protein
MTASFKEGDLVRARSAEHGWRLLVIQTLSDNLELAECVCVEDGKRWSWTFNLSELVKVPAGAE